MTRISWNKATEIYWPNGPIKQLTNPSMLGYSPVDGGVMTAIILLSLMLACGLENTKYGMDTAGSVDPDTLDESGDGDADGIGDEEDADADADADEGGDEGADDADEGADDADEGADDADEGADDADEGADADDDDTGTGDDGTGTDDGADSDGSSDPCGETEVADCSGVCTSADLSRLGDDTCDDSSPDFNCETYAFDGGDCEPDDGGGTVVVDGECYDVTWFDEYGYFSDPSVYTDAYTMSCGGTGASPDVAYMMTPPVSGDYCITAQVAEASEGTFIVPVVSVWEADCATELVCAEGSIAEPVGSIEHRLEDTETYLVVVEHYYSYDTGYFELIIEPCPLPL
jgi:hypothetical protein